MFYHIICYIFGHVDTLKATYSSNTDGLDHLIWRCIKCQRERETTIESLVGLL